MAKEKRLSTTLRKLHYYAVLCPNAISQKAALAALTGPQDCVQKMVTEYTRRRKLVLDQLDKIEYLSYTKPKGTFYVFPNFSTYQKLDKALATHLLKAAGVVTAPGSGFGKAGEGHLRISYSVSYEQVKRARFGMHTKSSFALILSGRQFMTNLRCAYARQPNTPTNFTSK